MSDPSPISATSPTVLAATFDKWAIQSVVITGDGCRAFGDTVAGPISAAVQFVKARVLADGVTWERSPLPADAAAAGVGDVPAEIASGSALGQALATALDAIRAAAVLAAAGRL